MEERLIHILGTETTETEAVITALEAEGGRVLHRYGSALVILDNDRWPSIQSRIADRIEALDSHLERLSAAPSADLSDEDILAAAFALRQTTEFKAAKRARPNEGQEWAGPETFR